MDQYACESQPALSDGYLKVVITVGSDQCDLVVLRNMPVFRFVEMLNYLYGRDNWRINV